MALADLSSDDLELLMDELRPPRNLGVGNAKQNLFMLERVGMIEVEIEADEIVFKMPKSSITDLRITRRARQQR